MKATNNSVFNKISNELPFSVPKNYFNDFASNMDKQIGYKAPSKYHLKPWMYMAAVFAGVFVLSSVFYSTRLKTASSNTESYDTYVMAQVDETAMVDYYLTENSKK